MRTRVAGGLCRQGLHRAAAPSVRPRSACTATLSGAAGSPRRWIPPLTEAARGGDDTLAALTALAGAPTPAHQAPQQRPHSQAVRGGDDKLGEVVQRHRAHLGLCGAGRGERSGAGRRGTQRDAAPGRSGWAGTPPSQPPGTRSSLCRQPLPAPTQSPRPPHPPTPHPPTPHPHPPLPGQPRTRDEGPHLAALAVAALERQAQVVVAQRAAHVDVGAADVVRGAVDAHALRGGERAGGEGAGVAWRDGGPRSSRCPRSACRAGGAAGRQG